jgi:hypothetical protein
MSINYKIRNNAQYYRKLDDKKSPRFKRGRIKFEKTSNYQLSNTLLMASKSG